MFETFNVSGLYIAVLLPGGVVEMAMEVEVEVEVEGRCCWARNFFSTYLGTVVVVVVGGERATLTVTASSSSHLFLVS
ncbi:hypothetical protein BVC80_8765g14 [Macleaya cordata]|uniref:Uncharacterized protein n=1 Tax=Macleaya cordata TaxID=56857 RepID=A0A200QNB4_MACCD|nr:hypothetical protein BVC80_8765g14 [Macleaya cordata]